MSPRWLFCAFPRGCQAALILPYTAKRALPPFQHTIPVVFYRHLLQTLRQGRQLRLWRGNYGRQARVL